MLISEVRLFLHAHYVRMRNGGFSHTEKNFQRVKKLNIYIKIYGDI